MANVGRGVVFKKDLVEDAYRLDIRHLRDSIRDVDSMPHGYRRDDTITWERASQRIGSIGVRLWPGDELELYYTVRDRYTGEFRDIRQRVIRESTPCYFGGVRWWFSCPDCHRRCRILYLGNNHLFSCRICCNLTYHSQQSAAAGLWRSMKKAMRRRAQREWERRKRRRGES